jgi:hypothetical protein
MDDYELLVRITFHNAWYKHYSDSDQDESHWLNSNFKVKKALEQNVLIQGAHFVSVHPVGFNIDKDLIEFLPIWNGRSGDFDVTGFLDTRKMKWHSVQISRPRAEDFNRLWDSTVLLINPTEAGKSPSVIEAFRTIDSFVGLLKFDEDKSTEAFRRKYVSLRNQVNKDYPYMLPSTKR